MAYYSKRDDNTAYKFGSQVSVGLTAVGRTAWDAQAPLATGSSSYESQPPKITWEWAPPTARGGRHVGWAQWQLRRRRI